MKTKSQNKTVYRIKLEQGNYTTIARSVLFNTKLRDSSKTLLQLMLNNEDDWSIVLEYYRKKLNWSKNKLAGAVANLEDLGYLTKKNQFNKVTGENHYYFVVSEFGNLNESKEVTAVVKATQEKIQNDELLKVEEIPLKDLAENTYIEPLPFQVDDLFWDRVFKILSEELTSASNDLIVKVSQYYANKMETGELVEKNFNEEALRKLLRDKIAKNKNQSIADFTKWIDLYNDRGTKDQRTNMKAKALIYFNNMLNNGDEITESDVRLRLLRLKSSIVDANRNLDQRYQD